MPRRERAASPNPGNPRTGRVDSSSASSRCLAGAQEREVLEELLLDGLRVNGAGSNGFWIQALRIGPSPFAQRPAAIPPLADGGGGRAEADSEARRSISVIGL